MELRQKFYINFLLGPIQRVLMLLKSTVETLREIELFFFTSRNRFISKVTGTQTITLCVNTYTGPRCVSMREVYDLGHRRKTLHLPNLLRKAVEHYLASLPRRHPHRVHGRRVPLRLLRR